jgi:hypothetical protein
MGIRPINPDDFQPSLFGESDGYPEPPNYEYLQQDIAVSATTVNDPDKDKSSRGKKGRRKKTQTAINNKRKPKFNSDFIKQRTITEYFCVFGSLLAIISKLPPEVIQLLMNSVYPAGAVLAVVVLYHDKQDREASRLTIGALLPWVIARALFF